MRLGYQFLGISVFGPTREGTFRFKVMGDYGEFVDDGDRDSFDVAQQAALDAAARYIDELRPPAPPPLTWEIFVC
jgi:hypothetical protein